MTRKSVQCKICFQNMRSDNLSRHIKTHGFTLNSKESEIPTFDGSEFGTDKPKSKETMDKLGIHVRNNTVVASLSFENDDVLSQQPMAKEFLSRQQKDKSPIQQIEVKKHYGPSVQSNKNETIPTAVLMNCITPKSIGELWCNEDTSVSTTGNTDEESLSSVDVSSEKNIYSVNKEDEEELTSK